MVVSKGRVEKALFYLNTPHELERMPKYALIKELSEFGVAVNPNMADLDTLSLRKIMSIILDRIAEKYLKEVFIDE